MVEWQSYFWWLLSAFGHDRPKHAEPESEIRGKLYFAICDLTVPRHLHDD
jgi:hypothetical protein